MGLPSRTVGRCWTRSAAEAPGELAAALEAEVEAHLAELVGGRENDGRRFVTRNGHAKERRVTTIAGAVGVP